MQVEKISKRYDCVVVGGGLSGVCAAIAAARLGSKIALINNRGYIGGNASAEHYITVNGATGAQEFNFFAREDGIIEEILLENLHRNPQGNRYIWDAVLMDFIFAEENIDLYLNTTVYAANTESNRIVSVSALSSLCEEQYEFSSNIFIDDTGDGTLGYLAGAEYMTGRESRAEYGEMIAPETADHWVQPSTLIFYGTDTGRPVKYIPPHFAMDIRKTKLLANRVIPPDNFARNQWYYELGGDKDQTRGLTEIMNEQRAFVYGIWDYIKNSGKFEAENYDLAFVASMPSKREWRRLRGDVVLTENDIVNQTIFEDVIAYGGWSIDLHALEGVYSDDIQNRHYILKGIFEIPLRACYSKNVENLLVASRCLSASHVAHGSTRLIATLAMVGHAVGAAAHLCAKLGVTPRGIYKAHMDELRFLLTKNDHTVLGYPYRDSADLAQTAKLCVSSVKPSALRTADGYKALEHNMALVLPAGKRLSSLEMLVQAERDTALSYRLYLPANHESYNPETLVYENRILISRTDGEGTWISLPLGGDVQNRYVFIEFEENSELSLAYSRKMQPMVLTLIRRKNERETTWDVERRCVKEYMYRQTAFSLCFACPGAELYAPEQMTNGFKRPYDNTNLWVSDDRVDGEFIEITLDAPRALSSLVLTFDSCLNRVYGNSHSYDYNAMPEIVRDFDVLVKDGKAYRLLSEVRGNYRRVCTVLLNQSVSDRVKILFHATNGAENIRVFEVSLY